MPELSINTTGKFITVEGIDGAGKTAVVETIVSTIESAGIKIITTREPGGTQVGEALRNLILSPENHFSIETEILVMFAARAQHLEEIILPALREKTWVLCDRFTDSTYAYQGGGREIDHGRIKIIEDWVQKGFHPDLTLLLDADIETGRARVMTNGKPDRFEMENPGFHERVRKCYRSLAAKEPDRMKCIDATNSVEQVRMSASKIIEEFLENNLG